jgi:hypothetical protein
MNRKIHTVAFGGRYLICFVRFRDRARNISLKKYLFHAWCLVASEELKLPVELSEYWNIGNDITVTKLATISRHYQVSVIIIEHHRTIDMKILIFITNEVFFTLLYRLRRLLP